jgi:hypothetical protein
MNSPIVLRTYPTEIAAELARATLEANGVAALVRSADAAGLLRYVQGVDLLVRAEDAELANELLDGVDGVDGVDDEDDEHDEDDEDDVGDDADAWETGDWDAVDDVDDEKR